MRLTKRHTIFAVLCITVFFIACSATSPLTRSTKSDSEKATLNLQLGAHYLEMGMLSEAKEKLEKAVELDDHNADIHNTLAVLAERLQRLDEARKHFHKALELKPDNVSVQNNYGRFLCQNGAYQEGMKLLQQAATAPLNQHQWFAYTNIGLCYQTNHQTAEAELAFRQALQLNPDYAPALMQMQRISFLAGQYLSARAFLERYLSVAEHTAQTLWVGIQTETALGNRDLAERYRQLLLTNFPASEQARQLKLSSGQ